MTVTKTHKNNIFSFQSKIAERPLFSMFEAKRSLADQTHHQHFTFLRKYFSHWPLITVLQESHAGDGWCRSSSVENPGSGRCCVHGRPPCWIRIFWAAVLPPHYTQLPRWERHQHQPAMIVFKQENIQQPHLSSDHSEIFYNHSNFIYFWHSLALFNINILIV